MEKPRLNSENKEEHENAVIVLNYSLQTLMKLLHPFMPFVTTEIYDYLKEPEQADLMVSKWPTKVEIDCEKDVDFVENLKDLIVKVRNIRTNMNVHPSKKVRLVFVTDKYEEQLKDMEPVILRLVFGNEMKVQNDMTGISNNDVSVNVEGINLYMPFAELVDIEEEKKRLQEEKKKLEGEVKRSQGILSNQGFLAKAPESKINEEKEKFEKYKSMLEEIDERLKNM